MKRFVLLLLLMATPLWAVEPDEMLPDPALEGRAQALDESLRCVQCRSESIASSNADWARDARLMVRELIADGASDQQVVDFFTERYGDYVLMKPRAAGTTLLLWLSGPVMLVVAGIIAALYLRRRRSKADSAEASAPLSESERARLDELLNN